MRIAVIVVKEVEGDENPPVIAGAWDEWTIDENYEGFEEELAKIKKKHRGCEVRVAYVKVPDSFLNDIFKPFEIEAKVAESSPQAWPRFSGVLTR